MASLSVRDLDDDVRERLRRRAAAHGRSMEAEVRSILTAAVQERQVERNWLLELHGASRAAGGAELDLPARELVRAAPTFD